MPTETLVVVAGISAIFALFAGVLAWADFYTRGIHSPRSAEIEDRVVLSQKI